MTFSTPFACIAFAMLRSLPAWHEDLNEPDRDARLHIIAEASATAVQQTSSPSCDEPRRECRPWWGGPPETLLAGVIDLGWSESKFARRIHAGECRIHECDPLRLRDGTLVHQARSPWQLHHWAHGWESMVGAELEPTTLAASAAARLVASGWGGCGNGYLGAVTRYAGRGGCSWSGGQGRVRVWLELERVGRKAAAECAP